MTGYCVCVQYPNRRGQSILNVRALEAQDVRLKMQESRMCLEGPKCWCFADISALCWYRCPYLSFNYNRRVVLHKNCARIMQNYENKPWNSFNGHNRLCLRSNGFENVVNAEKTPFEDFWGANNSAFYCLELDHPITCWMPPFWFHHIACPQIRARIAFKMIYWFSAVSRLCGIRARQR